MPTKRPVVTNAPVSPRTFVARVNRNYGPGGAYGQRASCIIGRVSANGRGIAGSVLYANNGVANSATVTTNANGDYSICRLGESRWSIVLTFVPRADVPSKSRISGQVVAVVIVNGNPDQIASVDFIER